MLRQGGIRKGAAATVLLVAAAAAGAQEGGPGATRLLVTEVHVKPEKVDQWLALERTEVVPAMKKAGVKLKRVPDLSY